MKPRITRTGTDILIMLRAALGQAKLALRFQIPSQARLHGIVKTQRSLATRAPLLFAPCARSKIAKNWHPEKTVHARLAGIVGFLKRHLQACLRGYLQKSRSIRAANKSRDFSAFPFDLRLPFGAAPFGPTFGCSSLRPPARL